MKCTEIGLGTYGCTYSIIPPYLSRTVDIDKCLLPEILSLWERGIKTTGCCCGHGHLGMAYIGVLPEFIPKMKELGYKVFPNNCRPMDEDSFVPKTRLNRTNAEKGFNRWDAL